MDINIHRKLIGIHSNAPPRKLNQDEAFKLSSSIISEAIIFFTAVLIIAWDYKYNQKKNLAKFEKEKIQMQNIHDKIDKNHQENESIRLQLSKILQIIEENEKIIACKTDVKNK
ncbi:hypothetical protein A3Q56_03343 [Intoshia linei]|uniref:Optic atrophy 3 protein n=1 Tax=Intoshia linei TaxID=1819745 RepID=A0A177B5X7_9BILA|nr:hypothetical protein A3Q56_03343 [Intoshia linei]